MEWLKKVALILAAIGAINWTLHAFGFGLVDLIFGAGSTMATVLYVIISVCGIYALIKAFNK